MLMISAKPILKTILIVILILTASSLTLFSTLAEGFQIWDSVNWGDSIHNVVEKIDYTESYYTRMENDSMTIILPPSVSYRRWMEKYVDKDMVDETKYIAYRFDASGRSLCMISVVMETEFGNGEAYFLNAYEKICEFYGLAQITYNEDSFNAKWELTDCNTNLVLSDFGYIITLSMFDRNTYA